MLQESVCSFMPISKYLTPASEAQGNKKPAELTPRIYIF